MELGLFDKVKIIRDKSFERLGKRIVVVKAGKTGTIMEVMNSAVGPKTTGYCVELYDSDDDFDRVFVFEEDELELIEKYNRNQKWCLVMRHRFIY